MLKASRMATQKTMRGTILAMVVTMFTSAATWMPRSTRACTDQMSRDARVMAIGVLPSPKMTLFGVSKK